MIFMRCSAAPRSYTLAKYYTKDGHLREVTAERSDFYEEVDIQNLDVLQPYICGETYEELNARALERAEVVLGTSNLTQLGAMNGVAAYARELERCATLEDAKDVAKKSGFAYVSEQELAGIYSNCWVGDRCIAVRNGSNFLVVYDETFKRTDFSALYRTKSKKMVERPVKPRSAPLLSISNLRWVIVELSVFRRANYTWRLHSFDSRKRNELYAAFHAITHLTWPADAMPVVLLTALSRNWLRRILGDWKTHREYKENEQFRSDINTWEERLHAVEAGSQQEQESSVQSEG